MPNDLKVSIANCLIGGEEITMTGNMGIKDVININVDGKKIQLRQHADVINGEKPERKNAPYTSTEAIIQEVDESGVEAAELLIQRICWMLSFACTCRVIPYAYEYPADSGKKRVNSITTPARFFRPTFELTEGKNIRQFIEQCFPNYKQLEKSRKLRSVIDYLSQAEVKGQLMEVRSILSFITLENLKHSYANSKGYAFVGNYFRKTTGKATKKTPKYFFSDLATEMLNEVGMPAPASNIYSLRNELIHSGLSSLTFHEQLERYEDVHDLIREYLLRLLGYKGAYTPYAFNRRGNVINIT
ncbi:hypothetical protein SAMN05192589_1335 [Paracidovorax valerianellae]|uniref:Apea-like HEPN domain-containing protein n=1 Tax=Paracidovorax valerianellae TaxID=187868 RepID=A0A1G7FKN6_9BURK|nr:hypothetical protein [Paracidovorax valerianellae]SDE76432.1 hypothetical protein SAMN05192589_1335 [Paracidovorax valerianellae]